MNARFQAEMFRIRQFRVRRWQRRRIAGAGFWFVDVPRTGTTSLKTQLGNHFGPPFGKSDPAISRHPNQIRDHTPAQSVRELMQPTGWDALYTFSFVRNPWDRAVSIFQFRKQQQKDISADITFLDYIRLLRQPAFGFRVPESPFQSEVYYWNAADFLVDEQGELLVDDVYKYEERQSALKSLSEKLKVGLDSDVLLYDSRSQVHFSELYCQEAIDVVGQHCWKDIELFGYDFSAK